MLLIDALDEYAAVGEGDAVDRVLEKLGALGYPRFVLSCRVVDWRSATAKQGIVEQYGSAPLELRLQPFDAEDARAFLAQTMPERADEIVKHFTRRGLTDLLGNPQTLKMIADIAKTGDLPDTIGGIFARAVAIMQSEHRPEKAHRPLAKASPNAILDAIGAGFAALILTGSEALVPLPGPAVAEGDLPMSQIADLPDATNLGDYLDSRLWRPVGLDRFADVHRRIGDYLGARWLAKYASTPVRRKRLLARFRERGLVPASLRGLHAWLAHHSPTLALDIITADPMGLVEYGDVDTLTVEQGRALLRALKALSWADPDFRNQGRLSMRGVMRNALRQDVRRLLTATDTEVMLCAMLLDAMKNSPIATSLSLELQEMMLDPDAAFVVRRRAGEALAALSTADWPTIVERLRCLADDGSVRLATEMLGEVGFDRFDDQQIVEILFAQVGASLCTLPKRPKNSIVGVTWGIKRELPDHRIDGVLDVIAEYTADLRPDDGRYRDAAELTDCAYTLISRRVALGPADPLRLWRWMERFDVSVGYHREAGEAVAAYLRADHAVRRAIQRHVLLDLPGERTVFARAMMMQRRSPALSPSLDPQDVAALLDALGTPATPTECQVAQWRDLVQLAAHGPGQGAAVRAAARPFLRARGDLLTWLDALATPRVPDWQARQEQQGQDAERKRKARWAMHRQAYEKDIDKILAGDFQTLFPLAQCYLKLFDDVAGKIAGPPAHERIAEWLGPELQAAAFEGFEAFLHVQPPRPNADEIAEGWATNERWNAGSILVAALAERVRTSGLADLPNERLHAGMLELRQTGIDHHAEIDGLTGAIEAELRLRGEWEAHLRLHIEPQLAHRTVHVDGLNRLGREEQDADLATRLCSEWLHRFPDLPMESEQELINRLLASGKLDALRDLGAARRAAGLADDAGRRRNWDAVEILVDLDAARWRLGDQPERELLWNLRQRAGNRRGGRASRLELSTEQSTWIVRAFRATWPDGARPSRVTSGDMNDWDASEYIRRNIDRVGDDASDAGLTALADLLSAPADGYTDALRYAAAEQRRKRAETDYTPPSIDELRTILTEGAPTDAADLQAVMLDALDSAQARLRGDPLDWRKGFYTEAGLHRDENSCRHELLKMLDGKVPGVELRPETHLADGKRVDVECSVRPGLMLPIEVKGQWHSRLWNAADAQLDHLYVNDWRAERGIYLVLWFDAADTFMPAGEGKQRPATPDDLCAMLTARSQAAREGRVVVFVLDLTRPALTDA